MASYPSAVYAPRIKENKTGIVYDPTQKTIGYAEDVVKLDNEVVALETELGLLPKATSASVSERLKGIRSLSDAAADVLVVKGSNVGIGMTTPGGPLNVYANGGAADTIGGSIILNRYFVDATHQRGGAIFNYYPSAAAQDVLAFAVSGDSGSATTPLDIAKVKMVIGNNGNVGIGTTIPTAKLDINSDILRLRTAKTPATAGAAGNAGDICWDANFIYICVATNSWTRVAIAAW